MMDRFLRLVVLVGALVCGAHLLMALQFRRQAQALIDRLDAGTAPGAARDDLPAPVAALARRAMDGAVPVAGRVRLEQAAEMEMNPGAGWQALSAQQAIATARTGFVWNAVQRRGPVTMFRVIDAFVEGRGLLKARLLGSIPVANAAGGDFDRGEAMRYLAELPWAPDAILLNRDIAWTALDTGEIEARLAMAPRDAVVRFALDAVGDIAEMNANDRPATGPDGAVTLRPWRGRFTGYGMIGGRRIPLRGEVGYIVDGVYAPYWRGEVTAYRVD